MTPQTKAVIAFAHLALAALALPPPAHAAASNKAKALIDHYLQATGSAAFSRERFVHGKGRIKSMGMTGAFEQWTERPDRFLTRYTLGPIKTRVGFDGTTGWETDLNSRKVTILDGKDLEALRSEAYFENECWALPDQGGGTVEASGPAFRGEDEFRALEITPPVGPSRTLWFNTRTGMIDRVISRRDNHEWEQWLTGYRELGGRLRATVQTSMTPTEDDDATRDPEESRWEERVTLDSVWVGAAADSGRFAPPQSRAPVAWLKTPGVARLNFRYGTRHVWIKASINGAPPADFLLDTGCSITAIDRTYAEHIGLEVQGTMAIQGIAGVDEGGFARVHAVRVTGTAGDGAVVKDLKVGIVDLGEEFEAVMWRKAAGLIGYDFLSRFVVEIDYDRQIVTLRDPATFAYRGSSEAIPMRLFSGIPTVQATLNDGCTGEFIVDVGNSFGLDVHGSMVRRCQMLSGVSGRKQVEVYTGGIGGASINWLCRLDRIRIGPHQWTEPIAGLSLGSYGLIGSKDYSGNLGNGVLERFKITFDYEHRKLYLEPGKRFADRDHYSRSGTFLVRLSDQVMPGAIVRGSAANEAGLKIMDHVTSIDGRPALNFTPEELDRLFFDGAVGSVHTLTIERNGVHRTLKLTLADVL